MLKKKKNHKFNIVSRPQSFLIKNKTQSERWSAAELSSGPMETWVEL